MWSDSWWIKSFVQQVRVKRVQKISDMVIVERDWELSTLLPMYKGKVDTLECGSYWAITLLERGMEVIGEKVKTLCQYW